MNSFSDRKIQWQSCLSQGPSVEDLYRPIISEKWDDDPIVKALAERAHHSDECDADFVFLKVVSAFRGPQELASIHALKGLARFKCIAASVCDRVAQSRRQPEPPHLRVRWEETPTEAIMQQYDSLIKAYHCVTLQVTDAVAQVHRLRGDLMKAACLLSFSLLIKFV